MLAELAEQDLQLEHKRWASELAQHENAYAAAMARADRTQLVISQARADEARPSWRWWMSSSDGPASRRPSTAW